MTSPDTTSIAQGDPNAPVPGNPDGDVTIVEFFDYNGPYCNRAMTEVQAQLEAEMGGVRSGSTANCCMSHTPGKPHSQANSSPGGPRQLSSDKRRLITGFLDGA